MNHDDDDDTPMDSAGLLLLAAALACSWLGVWALWRACTAWLAP